VQDCAWGDEISRPQVGDLIAQETLLSAKNAALRLLAVRPRSEKEIVNRLREKEFDERTSLRLSANSVRPDS